MTQEDKQNYLKNLKFKEFKFFYFAFVYPNTKEYTVSKAKMFCI